MQNCHSECILSKFCLISSGPLISIRYSSIVTTFDALSALVINTLDIIFHAHLSIAVVCSFEQGRAVGGMTLTSFHSLLDLLLRGG